MKRVFIVGIDGATFDLIKPWASQGLLPNFKKFMERGTTGYLRTTIPPLTPSAWTSFMTGLTPERHGVFDFYYLGKDFKIKVSTKAKGVKSIWRILSASNKKVISIAVPMTYPPEPVNGIMIGDFFTPSLESRFTYPPDFKETLLKNIPDYKLIEDWKYTDRDEDRERYRDAIFDLLDVQFRTTVFLMEKYPWDVMMTTFLATDHSQHYYWKFMDKKHPDFDRRGAVRFGSVILDVYKKVDEYLGYFMDTLKDTTIVFMSDHGAGPLYGTVYMNNFLKRHGFLKLKSNFRVGWKRFLYGLGITPESMARTAARLGLSKRIAGVSLGGRKKLANRIGITFGDVDWGKTYAYSFGYYSPIYINSKLRSENGVLSREDHTKVEEDIVSLLKELKDPYTGGRLITRIWRREELYPGPINPYIPDIILSMGDFGYTGSTFPFPSRRIVSKSMTYKSGDHRINGVFGIMGEGIKQGLWYEGARIIDITPTILEYLGIKTDVNFSGSVLKIFEGGENEKIS